MDPQKPQDNLLKKKRAELEAKYAWIRDYVDKGEMINRSTYVLKNTPLPEHLKGKRTNMDYNAIQDYTIKFLKERNIVGSIIGAGCDDKDFWFSVQDATTRPTTPEPSGGGCVLQ